MKSILNILFILSLIASSCSERKIKIVENDLKGDQYYYSDDYKPYTGVCITEYYDTGKIKAIRTLKSGIMNGETKVFFEDGTLRIKGKYFDGKYHGKWTGWYKNGNTKFEINHDEGMLHGKYTLYDKDGSVTESGFYEKNKRVGKWMIYDHNQRMLAERIY